MSYHLALNCDVRKIFSWNSKCYHRISHNNDLTALDKKIKADQQIT